MLSFKKNISITSAQACVLNIATLNSLAAATAYRFEPPTPPISINQLFDRLFSTSENPRLRQANYTAHWQTFQPHQQETVRELLANLTHFIFHPDSANQAHTIQAMLRSAILDARCAPDHIGSLVSIKNSCRLNLMPPTTQTGIVDTLYPELAQILLGYTQTGLAMAQLQHLSARLFLGTRDDQSTHTLSFIQDSLTRDFGLNPENAASEETFLQPTPLTRYLLSCMTEFLLTFNGMSLASPDFLSTCLHMMKDTTTRSIIYSKLDPTGFAKYEEAQISGENLDSVPLPSYMHQPPQTIQEAQPIVAALLQTYHLSQVTPPPSTLAEQFAALPAHLQPIARFLEHMLLTNTTEFLAFENWERCLSETAPFFRFFHYLPETLAPFLHPDEHCRALEALKATTPSAQRHDTLMVQMAALDPSAQHMSPLFQIAPLTSPMAAAFSRISQDHFRTMCNQIASNPVITTGVCINWAEHQPGALVNALIATLEKKGAPYLLDILIRPNPTPNDGESTILYTLLKTNPTALLPLIEKLTPDQLQDFLRCIPKPGYPTTLEFIALKNGHLFVTILTTFFNETWPHIFSEDLVANCLDLLAKNHPNMCVELLSRLPEHDQALLNRCLNMNPTLLDDLAKQAQPEAVATLLKRLTPEQCLAHPTALEALSQRSPSAIQSLVEFWPSEAVLTLLSNPTIAHSLLEKDPTCIVLPTIICTKFDPNKATDIDHVNTLLHTPLSNNMPLALVIAKASSTAIVQILDKFSTLIGNLLTSLIKVFVIELLIQSPRALIQLLHHASSSQLTTFLAKASIFSYKNNAGDVVYKERLSIALRLISRYPDLTPQVIELFAKLSIANQFELLHTPYTMVIQNTPTEGITIANYLLRTNPDLYFTYIRSLPSSMIRKRFLNELLKDPTLDPALSPALAPLLSLLTPEHLLEVFENVHQQILIPLLPTLLQTPCFFEKPDFENEEAPMTVDPNPNPVIATYFLSTNPGLYYHFIQSLPSSWIRTNFIANLLFHNRLNEIACTDLEPLFKFLTPEHIFYLIRGDVHSQLKPILAKILKNPCFFETAQAAPPSTQPVAHYLALLNRNITPIILTVILTLPEREAYDVLTTQVEHPEHPTVEAALRTTPLADQQQQLSNFITRMTPAPQPRAALAELPLQRRLVHLVFTYPKEKPVPKPRQKP